MPKTAPQWDNRIVGHADVNPADLVAHDRNWRTHPVAQVAALKDVIAEVGYLRSVTVNKRTGRILDGHLRVKLALETGQKTVPVEYVDVPEDQEALALATFDPLAGLAEADAAKLAELLAEIDTDSEALDALLAELAALTAEEDGPAELKDLDTQPPPAMTWVLIGIPTVAFGSIAEDVERIAEREGVVCETTSNNG